MDFFRFLVKGKRSIDFTVMFIFIYLLFFFLFFLFFVHIIMHGNQNIENIKRNPFTGEKKSARRCLNRISLTRRFYKNLGIQMLGKNLLRIFTNKICVYMR